MSKEYEKLIAKHELLRRRALKFEQKKAAIESLSDQELQRIVDEPTESEEAE
jgi:hypothetical protein